MVTDVLELLGLAGVSAKQLAVMFPPQLHCTCCTSVLRSSVHVASIMDWMSLLYSAERRV